MLPKRNPLKLNRLQCKTLALLQQMARSPRHAQPGDEDGAVMVSNFPPPHGDHYHIGDAVVRGSDATGLSNAAVFAVLERKGLIRSLFPMAAVLSAEALAYDTGVADSVLLRADH
jgi:hypothetical protein